MTTSPNCSSCRLHAGSDTKVSEYRVHCSLFCLDLDSHRPVRVPMLIAIHLKHQQWVCELQNWTTEHWKKVNDEPHFLLHQVYRLPGEHVAPGFTMGRMQTSRGSVIYWDTVAPAIHEGDTVTHTTYLSTAADHVHSLMKLL